MLAPVCEFLSVKMGEPLDETPSLGQYSFSFTTSMFFSFLTTFSFSFLIFKAGEADSSCNFKKSSFEDLASVFFSLSSLDVGKPRLTVSIAWKASSLLVLLSRPPLLLSFCFGV